MEQKVYKEYFGPVENAFDKYNEILLEANKQDKDKLFLLVLGPTATVLAYDLYKAGYQTVDIGHVDIEYEWFLRNATEKIKIKGKYMGESAIPGATGKDAPSKEERIEVEDIVDEKYENQIIAKII